MNDQTRKYPANVTVARLYERTSKSTGNIYLAGRLGYARVAIVKSSALDDEGNPIWEVRLSEAPPADRHEKSRSHTQGDEAKRDWQRPSHTTSDTHDLIPF